ncbi:cilia- and flagella-associated protein 337-like [Diadema setosum]|uniref:cilia- and flagella-associated protein 337-like n=1 Tax=Diadema setosum TaxID=31175 RepID=UPI003B3BB554
MMMIIITIIYHYRRCHYHRHHYLDSESRGVTLFEDQLNLDHLKELMSKFAQHEPTDEMPDDGTYSPGRIIKREAGNVTLGEFKSMVQRVLKSSDWDAHLEALFAKVDTSADGMVDWNEFVTYMLLHYRENDNMKMRKYVVFNTEPRLRHITQNKQDIVWCTIAIENPCRFITLSKEGTLCMFDENLRIINCVEIREGAEDPRSGSKRRFKTWYNDIVFMGNVNRLAIASNNRSIRFWDIVNNTTCIEEFNLYALSDVPSCLDYWYDKNNPSGESLLVMGSDKGSINLFYFLRPQEKIFETPFKPEDTVQKVWMHNICQHQRYVRHVVLPNVHTEYVRKVRFLADKDFILSSSGCRKTPLIMMDVQGKRKSYTYKLSKGVECFDYNRSMNVIATGGIDHVVRLWNPYVPDKPVAFLRGHLMTVVGVVINEFTRQVYSYAKDGAVKIWDLYEYTCLQTLNIRYTCLQNSRNPEFGAVNVVLYQGRHLMTSCGDNVALLTLVKNSALERRTPVTHETQLCSAVYNAFFRQVATAADDSTVSVWNLETGAKSFTIPEAHGSEEITCLAISTTGRRLYTGARNGIVKVWNFQNGHHIHDCESVGDDEVTGLVSMGKKKGFLSVGWSRKIVQYKDGDCDTNFLRADTNWKGGQVHRDDILAVDYSPPSLLATASFDGEILVWSLETQKISVRLRKGQPTIITQKLKSVLTQLSQINTVLRAAKRFQRGRSDTNLISEDKGKVNSRPNSRHMSIFKRPQGFSQAPVDKLLFLSSRLSRGITDSSVLVSSEAGKLHFWAVYGQHKRHRGSFYSSDSREGEESVLALGTNTDNSLLLSGDTMGHLYIWNIEHHCIYGTNEEDNSRPPLVNDWKAHDAAIVSIDYISHSCGNFILTASTDLTSRLWTAEGHFVGTFGQRMNWDLRNPDTYQHPKTPWALDIPPSAKKNTAYESGSSDEGDDDVFVEMTVEDATSPHPMGEDSAPTREKLDIRNLHKATLRHDDGSVDGHEKMSRPGKIEHSSSGRDDTLMLDANSNSTLVINSKVGSPGKSSGISGDANCARKMAERAELGIPEAQQSSSTEVFNLKPNNGQAMPTIIFPESISPSELKSGFFATQRDNSAVSNKSLSMRNSDGSMNNRKTQPQTHPLPPISKSTNILPDDIQKEGRKEDGGGIRLLSQSDDSNQQGPIKKRRSNFQQISNEVDGTVPERQDSRSISSAKISSQRCHHDMKLLTRSNTSLLGKHIEEGFARITNSRHERRQRIGGIDVTRVTRFGKICAPFQALATQSTKEVEFPASLPMTQRMRQRGVSCSSEQDLQHLSLSSLQLDFKSERSTQATDGTAASVRRATLLDPLSSESAFNSSKK